jgi:hypothetical protein
MRTLKNNNFEVVFKDEKNFKLINKFGDEYTCRLENGKIVSKTQFGLKYAMAARQQLGF